MSISQITNVYARALFEAARDAGSLDATGADLSSFAGALRQSNELARVLYNPKIDFLTKKKIVANLTEGADRIFVNGVNLMIDKGHSALIADLEEQFRRLLKKEKQLMEVEVTSAVALPEETMVKIRRRIEDATGKKVEISEKVDETIIGGLVLQFGDLIVDGSLKAKLAQLRSRLVQA